MSHFREIENLLGSECMTLLLNYVRGGNMDDGQLKDFVMHLGEPPDTSSDAPNILYGNHTERMSRDRDRKRDREFKHVLSDWWKTSLYAMTYVEAVEALDAALSHPDVGCKPLAFKLKQVGQKI